MQDFNFVCSYFTSISNFLDILNDDTITNIIVDKKNIHFYNRCFFSDHEGMKFLTVPVKKISGKKNFFDLEIDNSTPWKKIHFNTIKSAYGKTPYFPFYEDDLKNLYENDHNKLFEFNILTFHFIYDSLRLNKTERNVLYQKEFKIPDYVNHFGIRITDFHYLSALEFLFRFGPAGIFEILV